jgi:hypothetical protein
MLTITRSSISMLTTTHLRAISMPRKIERSFKTITALTSAIVTTIEFKQQKNKNSIQYQEHFLTEYSSTLTTYTYNS